MATREEDKFFGANLRRLRQEKGLTIKEFAEGVEIDPSQLSKMERGKCRLWLKHVVKFWEKYDIHPKEIAEGNGSLSIKGGHKI